MPGMSTAAEMGGMDMSGMDMSGMQSTGGGGPAGPITISDALLIAAMWLVMMVGMMTPSAAPMILIFAKIARRAIASHRPFASTSWFGGGYLLVWSLFAVLAAGAQMVLARTGIVAPNMVIASRVIGGTVLVLAGLYQLSSLKRLCLVQCQAPFAFIAGHGGFPSDRLGALCMGVKHGSYCVGCCWALMALLFVAGVMNLLWVAALTIVVLVEKLVPTTAIAYPTGSLLVAAGIGFILAA